MAGRFDFEGLDPEDLASLIQEAQEAQGSHSDRQQDNEWIQPLVQAVTFLAEQLDNVQGRLDALEGFIQKDFIGGLEDFYNENERESGIGLLKQKYGEDFEPFDGLLKELTGGRDHWSDLFDHLKEHYDDEGFDPDDFMDQALSDLGDHMSRLKDLLGASGKPKEGKKDVTVVEGNMPPDDMEEIIKRVKSMPFMRAM